MSTVRSRGPAVGVLRKGTGVVSRLRVYRGVMTPQNSRQHDGTVRASRVESGSELVGVPYYDVYVCAVRS